LMAQVLLWWPKFFFDGPSSFETDLTDQNRLIWLIRTDWFDWLWFNLDWLLFWTTKYSFSEPPTMMWCDVMCCDKWFTAPINQFNSSLVDWLIEELISLSTYQVRSSNITICLFV
jgi:hypothetical protein